ncbi:MAG: hypothetical protein DRQ97_08175 [Gammaproteobacteria bacterium]|nr:MAG: hypothetical protein DRQ97_08175 [Gammaproteobacteria bacterium]
MLYSSPQERFSFLAKVLSIGIRAQGLLLPKISVQGFKHQLSILFRSAYFIVFLAIASDYNQPRLTPEH